MADLDGFPNNVVMALTTRFGEHSATNEWHQTGRAVRSNDPNESLGIYGDTWEAVPGTVEMGGNRPAEPTLANYTIKVEGLVVSMDQVAGNALLSVNAKIVRVLLYRDPILRGRLLGLSEELFDSRETIKRWWIGRQKFQMGNLRGKWIGVSTSDFIVQTETLPTS